MSKTKGAQRWKELGTLDAFNNEGKPVKTQDDGNKFFREILDRHKPRDVIDNDTDHFYLDWLVTGDPSTSKLCPAGVSHFIVHANRDIGYSDDERGFSLVAKGSSYPIPFSYTKALSGLAKTKESRINRALHLAVEPQIEYWKATYFREGFVCPVLGDTLKPGVNLDVDYNPDFERLVRSFFTAFNIDDRTIKLDSDGALEEGELFESWQRYHGQNANLRFISIAGYYEKKRLERVAKNANPFRGLST